MSTKSRPKQVLPLAGERPLVVDTVERARALVGDEHLRILAGSHLVEPIREAVPDLPLDAFMVEPQARGTCPVLAWAAREIARQDPEAVLVSLHADHLIEPLDGFVDTVHAAVALAREEDVLVTVGVTPDRVETGYGHIQPGDPLAASGKAEAFRVRQFHEKPDADTARRYMAAGYLWNSGIFVWSAARFLEEVAHHAPEVHEVLPALEADGAEAFFASVPVCVVDRAVMERSDHVACVKAMFRWDDVGSWEALSRTGGQDAEGNVARGDATVVDGHGNVVFADSGQVVLFGVEDLVVVRTADTTLVMPRSRAAELKTLLKELGEAT